MATIVKVKAVRNLGKTEKVCDIEVEHTHNLFVGDKISKKAILAHNCALVEELFGIKISGWILAYIPRDNPITTIYPAIGLVSEKEKQHRLEILRGYDTHYGIIAKPLTQKSIIKLVEEKPCKNYDQYESEYQGHNGCPLAAVCFNQQRLLLNLEVLIGKSVKD